jgi:hypothetical protein
LPKPPLAGIVAAAESNKTREVAMPQYNILMLGASYGSLLATKLLFGGHKIRILYWGIDRKSVV